MSYAVRPVSTCFVLLGALALACNSGSSSDDQDGTDSTMSGDGDPGDGDPGDGDPGDGDPGDGDPGDGDPGDGDPDGCPPPDPPLAQTLDGTWADQPEPSEGFDCSLAEGDGPTWSAGLIASASPASIDDVVVGTDGNAYASGWIDEGGVAGLVLGVELGNGPNGTVSWARSWAYDGEAWPVRSMAGTSNGRLWLNLAPEHLMSVGYDGAIIDGPVEAVPLGTNFIDGLFAGAGDLLSVSTQREFPPSCLGNTRAQVRDQGDGVVVTNSDSTFTIAVFGLASDGAGGVWMMTHDLNGAGATIHHYDGAGDSLGEFGVSNADANVLGGALVSAADGQPIIALRGPFIVDVRRYALDGTELWGVTLPPLGNQDYGYVPHLAVADNDDAVVAFDVGSGMGLAQVSSGGAVDWAGRWTCGDPVEVHGLDVSANGQDIWVGGSQDAGGAVGWLAKLN